MKPLPTSFRRLKIPVLFLAALLFASLGFQARAAINDNCNGAFVIPATNAASFVSVTPLFDISTATVSNDPPLPSAQGGFDTNITHSVWFKFTPLTNGLYTISSGPDTDTTFKDTTMVMYRSTGDCGPLTLFSFNEDSGSLRASISTNLTAGVTYYIVVWVGRLSSPETSPDEVLDLQLRVSKVAPPSNDTCANPLIIPSTLTVPYLSPIIDTTLATTTPNLAPPCVTNIDSFPARDVWFRFTPSVSGSYIFSTGSDTSSILGNDGTLIDDTVIGIYTLPGGCGQAASQIACNDNSTLRAVLSATLTANTTYYIVIWDNSSAYVPGETALRLRVGAATKPSAETLPITSISSTGAVLGANINANGLLSRFWFEWGLSPSLGSTSAVKVIFASATTYNTNITVSGFLRDTVYYYSVRATNAMGRAVGLTNTFKWISTPPDDLLFEQEVSGASVLNFTGAAFHDYLVQGSSNLVDWTDLGLASTNLTQSPTSFLYRHSPPPPAPAQFYYRLKLP